MNFEAIEWGKYLLRNHYTAEQHAEMLREYRFLNLPEAEFPAYVAYIHEAETAAADPCCW